MMSTSQGTYVRIEQTSEAIRVTYEISRARGLELRTAALSNVILLSEHTKYQKKEQGICL